MSPPFLVELTATLDGDPPVARILAPAAATAIALVLATIAPADPAFLQYVYAPSLTLSFAEYFWILSDDDDARYLQGALPFNADVFTERVERLFRRTARVCQSVSHLLF
jgi:hypothetical protein